MPVNGHPIPTTPPAPPDPREQVARAVYAFNAEDGDATFDDLDPAERQVLIDYAEAHITAHIAALTASGFKLLPPGATLRPKSDDEAAAMLQAVRLWTEANARKVGLVGSVAPKLILPKGMH
jgi:hypothetical protein